MTREQIEKAAGEYSGSVLGFKDNPVVMNKHKAFMDGAHWRINSVWHDASEKPDKNQLVVFECRKTYGRGYSVNFGENYDLLKNVLLGWAYVIDLLPERKEKTK